MAEISLLATAPGPKAIALVISIGAKLA